MNAASKWVTNRVGIGYPLAALCLWLAHPTWRSIAAGTVIAGIGILIRGWAAGYLHKSKILATGGPYARTRNPLYLGSSLLAAGFGVASHSWIATVLLVAFFGFTYYAVMRREENYLRVLFGQAFDDYSQRVPLFWPRLTSAGPSDGTSFSMAQYMRNREYRAAIGVLLLMGVFVALAVWRR